MTERNDSSQSGDVFGVAANIVASEHRAGGEEAI